MKKFPSDVVFTEVVRMTLDRLFGQVDKQIAQARTLLKSGAFDNSMD